MRKKTIERNKKTVEDAECQFNKLKNKYEEKKDQISDESHYGIKDELIKIDNKLENILKIVSKNKKTETIAQNINILRDQVQELIYIIENPKPGPHSDIPPLNMKGSSDLVRKEQTEE